MSPFEAASTSFSICSGTTCCCSAGHRGHGWRQHRQRQHQHRRLRGGRRRRRPHCQARQPLGVQPLRLCGRLGGEEGDFHSPLRFLVWREEQSLKHCRLGRLSQSADCLPDEGNKAQEHWRWGGGCCRRPHRKAWQSMAKHGKTWQSMALLVGSNVCIERSSAADLMPRGAIPVFLCASRLRAAGGRR